MEETGVGDGPAQTIALEGTKRAKEWKHSTTITAEYRSGAVVPSRSRLLAKALPSSDRDSKENYAKYPLRSYYNRDLRLENQSTRPVVKQRRGLIGIAKNSTKPNARRAKGCRLRKK